MTDNTFTLHKSELLCEGYYSCKHPSGLSVIVFPKDLTTTYAVMGVKYGSINNRYTKDGEQVELPDGIAHFLEHKLFSNEDGSDSFEYFSSLGADANAYTSFNKTAYLFSCTENYKKALGELIDFVTHPYFSKESVASEIGIIGEEIKMYDDSPADRCFYGMLEGMYEHHSIRRNICGSASSIAKITPNILYQSYEAFYHPSNMALVVCGRVEPNDVYSIVCKHLADTSGVFSTITESENSKERPVAYKPYVEQKMQLSKPIFNIGFKDTDIPSDPVERQKKDATMAILDEIIFSRAGELYSSLYERDIISPNLSYGYSINKDSAYNSIAGEADDPSLVLKEIYEYIDRLRQNGLPYEDFLRGKRVMYSEFVKSFDSTDNIANNLLAFFCEDAELLSYADIIDSINFEDVCRLFNRSFTPESCTLSVVKPL